VTGLLALFGLPNVEQDTITLEDIKFRAYLEANGWDTSQLGLAKGEHVERTSAAHHENQKVMEGESEKNWVLRVCLNPWILDMPYQAIPPFKYV